MKADWKIEEITAAVEQLRALSDDGRARRKLLDELFRKVHDLKAKAAASGLDGLAAAAHEFENVLHDLRNARASEAIAEGARLYVVQTSFDVTDFEQRFQNLQETLNQSGEIISVSPTIDDERTGKLNFRILYAHTSNQELPSTSDITLQETSIAATLPTNEQFDAAALERCLENLTKEVSALDDAPIEDPFQQALRAGEAAALASGKQVDFETRGEDLVLDKAVCDAIANPLIHLVRNAVDHGIELPDERINLGKTARGKIVIEAVADQHQVRFKITDDGRGIDSPILDLIFGPGFSTATEVTELSGRGVGLDVVKTTITDLRGSVTVNSTPGEGACFEITIPIRLDPR